MTIIARWDKGLWTAGPACSAPPNTVTRLTNMQVNDEGVLQTRPGSVSSIALANTVDGAYTAGMHFFKLASGEVYKDTTDLGFAQTGTSYPNYLRTAAMTAFGLVSDIVFFPVAMKKYWSVTGQVSNWGITDVPVAPTVATGVAGNLTGSYTYKVAFYNSITKTVGILSAASSSLTVAGTQIVVSSIPAVSADPQVDTVYIYRTTGGITGTWHFVDSVPLGTIVYNDNVADAGLGDPIDLFYTSPPTANVATKYGSRMLLFDIVGNPRFGYASIGSTPEGFLSNVYELVADAGDTIQAAVQVGTYLYVFGQLAVYNFQIDQNNVITVSKLPTAIGTVNGRTVAMGGQGVYYVAADGVYLFQGFTPTLVSEQIDALFRGTDRGGLSTIASFAQMAGSFVGGRYYLTYYGADAQWHTVVFNERKNRWKHYTGWRYTVYPGMLAFPLVGLTTSVAQAQGAQGIFTDDGVSYYSECGFNIPVPMTEWNEIRGFRISAQCSGTLTVGFYDTVVTDGDTLVYSVALTNPAYLDGYRKHSLPNGSYFANPEVRISSTSPFTLRMFEPTVIPVRKTEGDFTRQTGQRETQ